MTIVQTQWILEILPIRRCISREESEVTGSFHPEWWVQAMSPGRGSVDVLTAGVGETMNIMIVRLRGWGD